jgi:transcriptional regulator with XRE-family HTH domain
MELGYRIKKLRERQGIQAKELAQQLGIDLSTINRIENGKIAAFKPVFLAELAKEQKVSIAELFEEKLPVSIQHNQQVQCSQWEKTEKLYEALLQAKEETIQAL